MGIFDKIKTSTNKIKEIANKDKILEITKDISIKAKEEVTNFNDKRKDNDNFKKAQKLYLGYCGENTDIATQITLKRFKDKQELLDTVIDLIGEPKNNKEKILLAHVLLSSKASYRKYALRTLEELRKNNSLDLELQMALSKIYIQEYQFEDALNFADEMISKFPHTTVFYCRKIDAYIKMNELDTALNYLKDLRGYDLYTVVRRRTENIDSSLDGTYANTLREVLDRLYIDVLEKKNKGYVYKPRKKAVK